MNIIVVGVGKVGSAICEQLVAQGHDIVALDRATEALKPLANKLDILTVVGDGVNTSALREAGAERADLLVAVSLDDDTNLLCCAAAKVMGTKYTIARVRNPEYAETLKLMKDELGLSSSINPELAAAKEISAMLRFPSATKVDTFSRGRVELAEFNISKESPLCGRSLFELRGDTKTKFLVCGASRNGEVMIPKGDFVIQAGDTVNVTVSEHDVTQFFKYAKIYRKGVKSVMIVGGSRLTYYLLYLLRGTKMNIKVIEKNQKKCRDLAESFPDITVINGDGTNPDLLIQEGIEYTDAFISLTDIDEENAINSMFAASKDVHKVITKINKMTYIDFYHKAGIESIVSPNLSTTSYIVKFVKALESSSDSEIEKLYKIMDGKAEALEFLIREESEITNVPLMKLKIKKDVILACIVRGEDVITPAGNDVIMKGDTVIVVTTDERINDIKDILK